MATAERRERKVLADRPLPRIWNALGFPCISFGESSLFKGLRATLGEKTLFPPPSPATASRPTSKPPKTADDNSDLRIARF